MIQARRVDIAQLGPLHARLLEGDPIASADLIETLYLPLTSYALKKHHRFGVDRDRAADLALNVLVSLIERPEQFQDGRGNLFGYLCMALDGDAINWGRDLRNREQIFSMHAVEVQEIGGNTYEVDPGIKMDAMGILERNFDEIVSDPSDEAVLSLILQDERDYSVYAKALQLNDLSVNAQTAEIKRRKDRIEKRLKRLKGK